MVAIDAIGFICGTAHTVWRRLLQSELRLAILMAISPPPQTKFYAKNGWRWQSIRPDSSPRAISALSGMLTSFTTTHINLFGLLNS